MNMKVIQAAHRAFKSIKGGRSGFTLVEVLVSVFVLAISLTGSLLVLTRCNVFVSETRQRSIASQAVKEEMEEIRDLSYVSILAMGNTFITTSMDNLTNPVGTLTIDDALSDSDIRRVTATLAWDSQQGRSLSTSLSTYITNSGINKQ